MITRGARAEQCTHLDWSIGLTGQTTMGHAFFMELLTHVLHAGQWLNRAASVFASIEVVLNTFAVIMFPGAYPVLPDREEQMNLVRRQRRQRVVMCSNRQNRSRLPPQWRIKKN